jgi:hypothetical protein
VCRGIMETSVHRDAHTTVQPTDVVKSTGTASAAANDTEIRVDRHVLVHIPDIVPVVNADRKMACVRTVYPVAGIASVNPHALTVSTDVNNIT